MSLKNFTQTERWKNISNIITNLGASLIIIGTLFKLMNWNHASIMLVVGMTTEALIFALGAFDAPMSLPKWERVYPQLDSDYDGEIPTPKVTKKSKPSRVEKEEPRRDFSPIEIPSITEINGATDDYLSNIRAASNMFEDLSRVNTNTKVASSLATFDNTLKGTISTLDTFDSNCSTLNSTTSKFVSAQVKQIEAQKTYTSEMLNLYQEVNQLHNSISDSKRIADDYKRESSKLNANIVELNNIYGSIISTKEKIKNNIQ